MAEITAKIVFNGREYSSPEEMPADVRRSYERAMELVGGVRGLRAGPASFDVSTEIKTCYEVGGRRYGDPDEMPPEVRRLFEQAVRSQEGSPAGKSAGAPPPPGGIEAGSSGAGLLPRIGLAALAAALAWLLFQALRTLAS